MTIQKITIKEFWNSFKEGDKLVFRFVDKDANDIKNEENRTFIKQETKNLITKRDNGVSVWLQKPKTDVSIFKDDSLNSIILKDYLFCPNGDLIIIKIGEKSP